MNKYFVYILKCNDGKYYTGYTANLSKRLKLHWSGYGANMTKIKKPFQLVYAEKFLNKHQALKREHQIKGWRRDKKENLIKYGKPIYLPPDHKDISGLMDDLVNFADIKSKNLDPLIIAGIFHKQFVIIHPFIDGNGRTARLATKVLLAHMGLNTFNLFSFENYYNKNVSKYFESVGVVGNYYEIKDQADFTAWLEYFTDGIVDELLRVTKILENEVTSPASELKEYHQRILDFIKTDGYIKDSDYATLTDRAKPTRNQDFNKLISMGLIKRFGKGKATYYKLKD